MNKFVVSMIYIVLGYLILTDNCLYAQTILLQENFNITPDTLSGQNDWMERCTSVNKIMITDSTKLRYSKYPGEGVGNAILLHGQTDRIQKSFTDFASTELFYSFLVHVSEAGSGDYFIGLFSEGEFRSRVFVKKYGTGIKFGLQKTGIGDTIYTEATYKLKTTYHLVVKYSISSKNNDDAVSLYVNPALDNDNIGEATIESVKDKGNDVVENIIAVQARPNAGRVLVDGIIVSSDWESIRTGINRKRYYVELPTYFSSNMVLQRDVPVRVNGWGSKGETVVVKFQIGDAEYQASSVIDEQGKWETVLPQFQACSDPCKLTVFLQDKPETELECDNILIGDVWFFSGEGNIEKPVNYILEADDVIAQANNYTQIRSFVSYYNESTKRQEKISKLSNPWVTCNSVVVSDSVSAIAYLFALGLHKNLNVPVGIMQSYRTDTQIETWMPDSVFEKLPLSTLVSDRFNLLDSTDTRSYPSLNFNGQIHPIAGFAIKGFVYYQGESNVERAAEYRIFLEKLIETWRSSWGMGELPFYYVQMPNIGSPICYRESGWADIREQQTQLLDGSLRNIGMVVSIDTHERPNSSSENRQKYPKNKKIVSDRLVKLVLEDTYQIQLTGKSPLLESYWISNDTFFVRFSNAGDALKFKTGDTRVKGFVISDETNYFVDANAEIVDSRTVSVYSPILRNPFAVRYGWADNPVCNLYNSADLPVTPFRTDAWDSKQYYNRFYEKKDMSNDATLYLIKENGRSIKNFKSNEFVYTVRYENFIPQITAIPNHPYAKTEVLDVDNERIVINVTAEDGVSTCLYEIILNEMSTDTLGVEQGSVTVFTREKTMYIINNSGNSGLVSLYDVTGTRVFSGMINDNSIRRIHIPLSGVYVVNFASSKLNTNQKILCP